MLIQQYLYIDRLLDSSLPHDLLNEYNDRIPSSISEEPETPVTASSYAPKKVKRTPRDIYRSAEMAPLLTDEAVEPPDIPLLEGRCR